MPGAADHATTRVVPPPDDDHERTDARLALMLAVAVVVARVFVLVAVDAPYDDAFITWRVARNVAAGLGPVFHEGERVQVVSSIPHTLLCALWFEWLGEGGLYADRVLACVLDGVAFHALAGLLVGHSDLPVSSRRVAMGALALYYALSLQAALAIPGGLETALYLVCAARALRAAGRGNAFAAGTWGGACALVRPEGALLPLVLVLGAGRLSTAMRVGLSAAAVVVPSLLGTALYYGGVVPQSVVAKSLLVHSARVEWSALVRSFAWGYGRAFFGALAALGVVHALRRRALAPVCWWGIVLGGCLATVTSLWPWYYAPLALVFAFAFALGVGRVDAALRERWGAGPAGALRTLGAATTVGLLSWYGAGELAAAGQRRAASRKQDERIAAYLAARVRADERVLCERVGVLGFVSRLRFEDYPGLTSPRVTDALRKLGRPVGFGPEDAEALGAVLNAVQPEYMVLRTHELAAAQRARVLGGYAEVTRVLAEPAVAAMSSEHTDMVVLARTEPAQRVAP